jgi:hypothetical protein
LARPARESSNHFFAILADWNGFLRQIPPEIGTTGRYCPVKEQVQTTLVSLTQLVT